MEKKMIIKNSWFNGKRRVTFKYSCGIIITYRTVHEILQWALSGGPYEFEN